MRPRASTLFIYGLVVTILSFIARSVNALLLLSVVNAVPGIVLGVRKFKFLLILFFIGLPGILINAIAFANTGQQVAEFMGIVIREGAVDAFIRIGLRLLSILGATLIFISLTSPREVVLALESTLRIPKEVFFPVAVGLRMLKLFEKDLFEIQAVREERGLRRIPLTPEDWRTVLQPLLGLGVGRATWIGIAAELRGFTLRRRGTRREKPLNIYDIILLILLVTQTISLFII